ncbi:MAG: patatin-like phospholipase family protein [Alteromonadaceae bacterium]|nr:patatin-like phospholipase family protein [Alteromonadaceae bacterium]
MKQIEKDVTQGLSLEGGGAKGVAYGTALKELNLENYSTVAGSSAGALTAAMVALGMTAEDISKETNKPMRGMVTQQTAIKYNNKTLFEAMTTSVPKSQETVSTTDAIQTALSNVVKTTASRQSIKYNNSQKYYQTTINKAYDYISSLPQRKNQNPSLNGEAEDEVARTLIGKTTTEIQVATEMANLYDEVIANVGANYTFGMKRDLITTLDRSKDVDLKTNREKHLLVTATKIKKTKQENATGLHRAELRVFSSREPSSDHVSIIKASAASGAFPGVFSPVEIDGGLYIDGGVMNNDPSDILLDALPKESKVLSLRLNKIVAKIEKRSNPLRSPPATFLLNRRVNEMRKYYGFYNGDVANINKKKNQTTENALKSGHLIEVDIQPQYTDTLSMYHPGVDERLTDEASVKEAIATKKTTTPDFNW